MMSKDEKDYNEELTIQNQENQRIAISTDRFQIREIVLNPKSGCNSFESRGTGIGCRC